MATLQDAQEQRILLRNVAWDTYERLLVEREENSAPRFTYDQGVLEIMSPLLSEHEQYGDDIRFLVRILAEELSIPVKGFGSMTLRREDIQGGLEPDACFYFQNVGRILGKRRLDLQVDPPPDLAVEVDITNPSLDKLSIYARLGVPEVWRYDARRVTIHTLEGDRYTESLDSRVLHGVTADALTILMEESKASESTAWARRVREWALRLGGADGRR